MSRRRMVAAWAAPVELGRKARQQQMAGFAHWKGTTPDQRSEIMRRLATAQNAKRSPAERRRIAMIGVRARLKKLSPARRSELASIAARARWDRRP